MSRLERSSVNDRGGIVDQRLVAVSRLFYEQHQSKTEIAESLNISITHVGRLLKEAARSGIVQVTIKAPRYEDLEIELREKFGLRDSVVVLASDENEAMSAELGNAAAIYFQATVKDHQSI